MKDRAASTRHLDLAPACAGDRMVYAVVAATCSIRSGLSRRRKFGIASGGVVLSCAVTCEAVP